MAVRSDIRAQLTKLDEQIIDLLGERMNLCQKATEEEEHAFDGATQAEMISAWEEAAEEQGMNPVHMNHLCKMVMKLCQATEE